VGGRKGVPRGRRAGTTGQRKRGTLKPLYPNLSGLPEPACPLSDGASCLPENSICKTVSRNFLRNSLASRLTMLVVSTTASSRYSCPRQTVTSVIKTRDNVVTSVA